MRRREHVRLGLCLSVLTLLALAGCENSHHDDGRYGGYYNGAYAYPDGGYGRGWWGRDRNNWSREASDDWKERKYKREKDNGRPGDAERFNDRLCHNDIRGDAPGGCED
jgi:hypothetical protein